MSSSGGSVALERPGEDDHVLAARVADVDRAERPARDGLVQLRELAGDRDLAVVAARRGEVVHACAGCGAVPRRSPPSVAPRRCRRADSSVPCRREGGSPRTRSATSADPEITSAVTAATGPGTADTRKPASSVARTSRSPGSEMPGVPASVTSATSSPATSVSSTSAMRLSSVCSLHTARRAALMPACWSSRPVRRVSSQHTSATLPRTSIARGARSPRLPIGVATRWRVGIGPGHASSSRTSMTSPTWSPHRSNAPASASMTVRAFHTGIPTRRRGIRTVFTTTPSSSR